MAQPWRLRHKLSLGLALVVGAVAVVLASELFGLVCYADTVRVFDRKLDEIQYITQVRDHVRRMETAPRVGPDSPPTPLQRDKDHLLGAARDARTALAVYAGKFPDPGDDERNLLDRLNQEFDALTAAVNAATAPGVETQPDRRLVERPEVWDSYSRLNVLATDLFHFQVSHMVAASDRATDSRRRALAVSGTAALVGLVLVGFLLYGYSAWVFAPLRALQAGIRRVRAGDFSRPIGLSTGDEFGELAAEFDAMAEVVRDNRRDLARQVNDRTRQLVRSERMVSVGFLAAGVAHEINNPLASIAFCAEALERRLDAVLAASPGADGAVAAKYLKMIQDESQRCKGITEKLLGFSRGEGAMEADDLTGLVGEVIDVVKTLPTSKGKRIDYRPDGPLVAACRRSDLKGVILNIIVNALESMDANGQLVVSAAARGGFAELVFADSGCGMTPDVLENLFEPFFTKSRTGNGTGLGLATSHLVIDQHGGTITAASPGPGQGSTFTVRLPLAAGEPAATLPFKARRTAAA